MNIGSLIAVRCRISRSGFSSERVFRVTLDNGDEHIGAAPVGYFFDENRRPLHSENPSHRGVQVPGFVAARVVSHGKTYLLSFPSGEVLSIAAGETVAYPMENSAHVLVQP